MIGVCGRVRGVTFVRVEWEGLRDQALIGGGCVIMFSFRVCAVHMDIVNEIRDGVVVCDCAVLCVFAFAVVAKVVFAGCNWRECETKPRRAGGAKMSIAVSVAMVRVWRRSVEPPRPMRVARTMNVQIEYPVGVKEL